MFNLRRKSKWKKLLAGAAVLKAVPKKSVASIAALAAGGYVIYRAMTRNTHEHEPAPAM